jgi:hypothetical protein
VERRGIARVALVLLAAQALYGGVWAQLAPRSFYGRFPLGPYNEHLLRDAGALVTGMGILALAAALVPATLMLVTAGVAWLVYAVPHVAYHIGHPMPGLAAVVLVSQVLLPLIVLAGVRRVTS